MVISATDQGGLQGRCNVSIRVTDVNRPPSFMDTPFTVRIPEDSPIGFHVLQIKANDEDRDRNSKLQFGIESQAFVYTYLTCLIFKRLFQLNFSIDSHTGLITVAKTLDREKQSTYLVNVLVSDGGDPPLNASTTLEIVLDDGMCSIS